MSYRKVSELPLVQNIEFQDAVSVEEDRKLYHMVIGDLFDFIHTFPRFGETPLIYTTNSIGGTVSTEGDVYNAIESIIIASYSIIQEDHTLYLGIVNSDTNRIEYDNWFIENSIVKGEVSTKEFPQESTTAFNGVIVSPFGRIIGTEDWIE